MYFKENIGGTYEARFSGGELPVIVRMVSICEKFMSEYHTEKNKGIEEAMKKAEELLSPDPH